MGIGPARKQDRTFLKAIISFRERMESALGGPNGIDNDRTWVRLNKIHIPHIKSHY